MGEDEEQLPSYLMESSVPEGLPETNEQQADQIVEPQVLTTN